MITDENLFGLVLDIATLSLIIILCISATLSLIRNKVCLGFIVFRVVISKNIFDYNVLDIQYTSFKCKQLSLLPCNITAR